jgi:hypothetical protein
MLAGLVALTIIFAFLFTKVGDKSPVQMDVDRSVQVQADMTRANMQVLQKIIASYIATEGQPPAALAELRSAGMLTSGVQDAWGREIRYERRSDSAFRLISAGRDGKFDTPDDIRLDY